MAVARALEHAGRDNPNAALWRKGIADHQLVDCRLLARRLKSEGRLAPGWTVATATDMLWALISTEALERLLVDRRWSPRQYAKFYALLLRNTFASPPALEPHRKGQVCGSTSAPKLGTFQFNLGVPDRAKWFEVLLGGTARLPVEALYAYASIREDYAAPERLPFRKTISSCLASGSDGGGAPPRMTDLRSLTM